MICRHILALALFGLAAGCGTAQQIDDTDSGTQDVDAAASDLDAASGTDAAVVPDAGDPLYAAATCTSNRMWLLGNRGSAAMNPGLACIACHSTSRAPFLTAAGTVYPTGHEPNLCNGTNVQTQATIELHDAAGHSVTLSPNTVGNFFYQGALTPPLTASIHYMGRTRVMTTPAPNGDCNSCHTQDGTMAAPGRITLP